ncbi:unnamed protein product [Phytomonas sp. EM1]|nr:unnamed protein product [Phytomonas sp. EM1]|eukprot:CCW59664.1 unnamed protein product [Phytomonas sp. isolate EM1]
MARGVKHYNGARNEGGTDSLERKGRGRGSRRGYTQLNARTPSSDTVAQSLSSSDVRAHKQKRSRSESDIVPENGYEDVTLIYPKPRRGQNNREKKQNSWTQARAIKVGEDSELATAAAIAAPLSSEVVAAQTATSLSLGPATITSSADFAHSNSSTGTTELAFWRRLIDRQRLVDSLKNSGAALTASDAVDASTLTSANSEMCLFSVGEDRLRTCIQSLLDLKGLMTYRRRCDNDSPSMMEGWYIPRCYFHAVVALSQLCESAIPTRFPPLVAADVAAPPDSALGAMPCSSSGVKTGTDNEDNREWWPSPVSLTAVQERLVCARRVLQCRYVYGVLAPLLRRCNTSAQLVEVLMPPRDSSLGPHAGKDNDNRCNGSNRFVPLSSPPSHRVEDQILSELLLLANQECALDTESWGTFAMPPLLKVRNGIYTVHCASRQEALEQLLKREEELYGLPPFLRFIRRAGTGSVPACNHSEDFVNAELSSLPVPGSHQAISAFPHGIQKRLGNGVCVGSRSRLSNSSQSYFFPSPESLNPGTFAFPDPAYYPTVQEELIEIAAKHGCFGLVIGEADHILQLWRDWVLYRTHLERHHWKQEHDCEDVASPAAMRSELKRDALLDNVSDEAMPHGNGGVVGNKRRGFHQGRAALPPTDPLLPFVYSTMNHDMKGKLTSEVSLKAVASAEHGRKDSKANGTQNSVFWLCENRWSTKTFYYGLVFEVVLQSDIGNCDQGDGMTPLTSLDADSLDDNLLHKGDAGGLEGGRPLIYYPSCLIELSR